MTCGQILKNKKIQRNSFFNFTNLKLTIFHHPSSCFLNFLNLFIKIHDDLMSLVVMEFDPIEIASSLDKNY